MTEAEAARANDLIALSNRLLDEAGRLLSELIEGRPRLPGPHRSIANGTLSSGNAGQGFTGTDPMLLHRAIELSAGRRHRELYFARSMFNEPAWDILLALYIRAPSAPPFTIVTLADHIRVPASSTLRWVGYLARENLVERNVHPRDRRKSHVAISGKGRSILNHYLSEQPI